MPRRRSGTDTRAHAFPRIPFDLFVLSPDPTVHALAEEAAPAALRLELARSPDQVQMALLSYEVTCGVIVDLDLERHELREMLEPIQARTADPPVLCVLRSATTSSLVAARALSPRVVFKHDPPAHMVQALRTFMRAALDSRLRFAARLLAQALARSLDPATLELFVQWALLQMPRRTIDERSHVSDSSMQARMGALCKAWGKNRLVDVAQLLLSTRDEPPPPDLIAALEAGAAEELRELRASVAETPPRFRTS
jgi:hypothetical protein